MYIGAIIFWYENIHIVLFENLENSSHTQSEAATASVLLTAVRGFHSHLYHELVP